MAGNPSYNQFGMNQRNFQDIVPTSQYDGQILSSLASLTNCIRTPSVPVMNNLLNAPGQRPPQQTYVNPIGNQQSNQWTASTDNASLMLLVTAACQERFKQPNTYDCRVKLQKLLLSKSYEPFLIQYLRSGFLTDFSSMASFDIIQNLTNVDMSKAKTVVKGIVDRMSSAQYYQPQVPGNQFSQDNSSNQNFGVQSNYDQFQVQGSNSSRNHDAIRHFNQVPRDNVSYPQLSPQQQQLQQQEFRQQELRQQQQQQQRMVQRGNVPNVTQNTQPLQQTNQSTSGHRWYAMPKETYQAGRVVQEKNNSMPSQGTVPLSHYNEPVPRSSSAHSEISPGIISNQGAQRISPPLSQINPRTVAQFSNGRMDSGGQNPPEIQPRPKSAETISSADRKRNHSSPALYIQQEKTVETVPSPNCPNNAKKQSSPAESKKLVRQQIEQLMQSSEKNMPKVAETNPKAVSQVQQPVSEGRLSGTPTLPVEQTAETISSEPSEDITDLFSMPVLSEDITDPKEGANRLPSRKDVTAHFDDMNVLSPYTADVVSNSLDSWLSGSKHSAILDRVGSKTSKGRQLTKPERPSVSPGSVERTAREEESNPSRRKEDPPQSETSDLAEYDPPLPVIKHKKREDRISPNKKSPEGENKPEYSKDSKAVREKQVSENRKSLFSVISDFMTENNSKGNGACERKSLESQDSMSGESMSAHQKTRHKSSEVSSSSTLPRHEKIFTNVETHHSENHKPDSGKSVEHSKAIIEQSCKEKIVSDWKKNHIEKESNLSKCHNRRKSCNDQELPRERLNRDRRTLTWDGSSVAAKLPSRCTEIENTSQKPVPLNGKLVDFNGHIVLQISILDGTYLLMQELLATCFKGHDPNSVYKAKTSALGVNNITLTHNCRKDVVKYLDYLKISYPSQLSIVSMSNAHRLFDYLEESKDTEKTAAEAMDSGVNDKEPSSDSNKNRSASPDSTENACKKPVPEESMDTSMVEGDQDDLQQNKVSSQSLNDLEDPNVSDLSHISALEDNDDAASTVSDATDIYCEGKPIASLGGDGSGEGSSEFRLPLGLDGGLAVVEKENSPDTYLRFVTVRGNKCFLYKDLFKLFGKGQVVNIVVNNYMKVKTCTSEEAEFFNRNQPGMSLVDPADDSLLHEKYVRKLFLFFGETFPKQKRAIDVILTNENPSSKRSRECDDCEPPSKKMRHPSGSVESYSDQNDGSSDKMDDETMKMFHLLKGQHMEMAAELAQLKTKLKQAEESNISLEKKYKLYSNNLIGVKADFEDVQKKNTLLEENFKAQEETLAQMKEELKGKDEVIATLTRERDHFKNFVERITDTYQDVAD